MTQARIVVADGFTANPGDLSWAELEQLGALEVYDRCGPEQLVQRCAAAHVVLTNKEQFTAQVLQQLPLLRCISVLATGTNVVDLPAARARGVVVSNVPGYSTDSVAQHVFALILELNHRVTAHHQAATDGRWSRSGDFSLRLQPIFELSGRVLGIVGLGSIGQRVAAIAQALGMQVIAAHSSRGQTTPPSPEQVQRVPLDEVFARSDVLTLHCPLNEQTRNLVNRERLQRMKPECLLINTGRGPLIDEDALAHALHAGWIRGAGLDVLSVEPPPATHPLLHAPRCLITPHVAWASVEARRRLLDESIANVRAFLQGQPRNVVSG